MQSDQLKGMLDRTIAVLATTFLGWMVKKGWIGESDSAALLPAMVVLPAIIYGAWVNRDKALLQSAANVVGPDGKPTIIVTSPALAAATPDQNNIVSNTDAKVINK